MKKSSVSEQRETESPQPIRTTKKELEVEPCNLAMLPFALEKSWPSHLYNVGNNLLMQEERALLLAYGASRTYICAFTRWAHTVCGLWAAAGLHLEQNCCGPSGRCRLFLDCKPTSLAPSAYRG